MNTERKFTFKITVVGDGMVGKTSLIRKFTKGSFKTDYIKTIGAQFSIFDKDIDLDSVRLLFWDIAGQDQFNFLQASFFKNSRAAIIVYSLEKSELGNESFSHILDWKRDINGFCGDIPIVLFANKVDLVREADINFKDLQDLVDDNGIIGYYITSAKTGEGVVPAFNSLIKTLYNKYKLMRIDPN